MTGPERDRSQDDRLIRELRDYRERLAPRRDRYIVLDHELDALLDAATERDALKAEACADPAPRAWTPTDPLGGGRIA